MGTVTITTEEYKQLLKDSIDLENVRNYVINDEYFIKADICRLLRIEKEKKEDETV